MFFLLFPSSTSTSHLLRDLLERRSDPAVEVEAGELLRPGPRHAHYLVVNSQQSGARGVRDNFSTQHLLFILHNCKI